MKNRDLCIFAAAAHAFYKKRSPETIDFRAPFPQSDLPYQELLGNYNTDESDDSRRFINRGRKIRDRRHVLRNIVDVKVLAVDVAKKRISLTMKIRETK